MAAATHQTTNHEQIRKWAEERKGVPSAVRSHNGRIKPGAIRIDFPGYSGKESLQPVSWDEFFEKFEERKLEFIYQERTASGKLSRFCKFTNRHN